MERRGGDIAGAKRANSSSLSGGGGGGGEDRLSALPGDILVLILLLLDSAAAAGRTSILSRRWRRLWALLPELRFLAAPPPHLIASSLAVHEAALRGLVVGTQDAAPESVAAWLPAAARRLSGRLVFTNLPPGSRGGRDGAGEEEEERGAFELPCFDRAAALSFDLGFLGLAVPPAGVFGAQLVELSLERVRFAGGAGELGAAVSSPRCPCLQKLSVRDAHGLEDLTICSESLLRVRLRDLYGLRRLAVAAPALQDLRVYGCFYVNQPVADISAPQLTFLEWSDPYDPSSVQLGEMPRLSVLFAGLGYFVYGGPPDMRNDGDMLGLLKRFQVIRNLIIPLVYVKDIRNFQYLMGDITTLPHVTIFLLMVLNRGHAFGPSLFHVLRLCSGIRKLVVYAHRDLKAQSACPSGCICNQQTNWKTGELSLNHLEEVEVKRLEGYEHEVPVMKQLFNCATVLKKMTIIFDCWVSESKAMVFRRRLSRFSRPGTRVEFYMSRNEDLKSAYLLVPEDRRSTRWLGVLTTVVIVAATARKHVVLVACTLLFLCVLVYHMLAHPAYQMFNASIPW